MGTPFCVKVYFLSYQEEVYLKELVRYIHLNPLRAKIVDDMKQLDTYAFCGHSSLRDRVKRSWQEMDEVLDWFASKRRQARDQYRSFVAKGIKQGQRKDLTGGGLLRSAGGWLNVKMLREAKIFYKSDERILGDSDFVEREGYSLLNELKLQNRRASL